MLWWPYTTKTFILPHTADEAQYLLSSVTKSPEVYRLDGKEDKIPNLYKFNGKVGKQTFSISKKVKYPQNFIPLIKGQIEGTKTGSIVIIDFTLFFASWFLLFLGSGLTLLIAGIFLFLRYDPVIGYSAFVLFLLNYIVSIANFNIHVKDSCKLLQEVLSF